jgi:predicted phosphodiesterase
MPTVPSRNAVKAIFVADLHLSLHPPIARSGEKDWLGVQAGYLNQLQVLASKHKAPIICAGDIFHTWNAPSELVNHTLSHIPIMGAIPGNHDLPLHNYEDMHRSAFYTLVMTDTVVAVCHQYCWSNGSGFPGASVSHHYKTLAKKLAGCDYAVFGDNHIPFEAEYAGVKIFNCGGFIRRNMDEKKHLPSVGLLTDKGIVRHYLDCKHDKFLTMEQTALAEKDGVTLAVSNFIEELAALGDSDVDFEKAVNQYCIKHNIPADVKDAIIASIQQ